MRRIITFAFFLCSISLYAQQEMLSNSMSELWYSNTTNPAFFHPNKRIAIGLPGLSLAANHSAELGYNDLFVKEGDKTKIDFSKAIDQLDSVNTLAYDQRIETFSVGIKLPGKWVVSAGHANRFAVEMEYPRTLPEILWKGNGAFIGKTINIAPSALISDFNEWRVGLAHRGEKFSFGAHFKYLTGISAVATDEAHKKASVTTSSDIYQLSLDADYAFYTKGLISAIDTSGLGFKPRRDQVERALFTKNTGYALDLGIQLQLTPKLSVSASALDLFAEINWDDETKYHQTKGTYQYDGVTIPGIDIINGADSLSFDQKLDTLNDIFKFQSSPASFKTKLPAQYYANVDYKFFAGWTFGLHFYHGRQTAAGVSARWNVLRLLTLGAQYSIDERSAANLGFIAALTPGPVQLWVSSDNILNAFTLKKSSAANLRLGLAMVF